MTTQPPVPAIIPDVAFTGNTNQRTLCVLLVDGSGSMANAIEELNRGLHDLQEELSGNPAVRMRVRLLVARIGDNDEVHILQDWTDAIHFTAPTIQANGSTPMGKAVDLAIEQIEDQKQQMKAAGVSYTRPLVYLITDGEPTDPGWESAAARCASAVQAKKLQLFAIGTEGANFEKLKKFGGMVLQLSGLRFRELFQFLSASVASASRTATGDSVQVALPASVTIHS